MKKYTSPNKPAIVTTTVQVDKNAGKAGTTPDYVSEQKDIHVGTDPVELDENLPIVKELIKSGRLKEYTEPAQATTEVKPEVKQEAKVTDPDKK